MPVSRRVRVQNLQRLERKLKAISEGAEAVLKPMLAQAATIVTNKQKDLVPVDTGALKDSIQWTYGDPPAGAMVFGKKKPREPGAITVTITAGNENVPYAAFVEFGTARTPAQPFFFTGYRASDEKVKALASRALKDALRESVRSGK